MRRKVLFAIKDYEERTMHDEDLKRMKSSDFDNTYMLGSFHKVPLSMKEDLLLTLNLFVEEFLYLISKNVW